MEANFGERADVVTTQALGSQAEVPTLRSPSLRPPPINEPLRRQRELNRSEMHRPSAEHVAETLLALLARRA